MSESLGGTPMTIFHTWYDLCEGVDRDSGFVMGGSHLMHDINHSIVKFKICMECG